MCIIIDTNKLHDFLTETKEAKPIRNWIITKGGKIVYSTYGTLGQELKSQKAEIRFQDMSRSGQATFIQNHKVEAEQDRLEKSGNCRSNDAHVLALAKASGARLLYTGDRDLIADFKDKKIINRPGGRIYSDARNKDLLTANVCR